MENTSIVLFILAFLAAILIAIRISIEENDSDQLVDESIDRGTLVEFQQEFEDLHHWFYPGERAWVIKIDDPEHVTVSNKPDDYCASDGCDPFKFCKVPISILKKVTVETNRQ